MSETDSLVDAITQAGAGLVARVEDAIGGPVYPIHEYVEPVPVGGDGLFYRCAWRTPQVMAWLDGHGVKAVVNLCSERSDAGQVLAAGMLPVAIPIKDGSIPTDRQAALFLLYVDEARGHAAGPLAFGCEAGIGRTGCMAALLLVKRYGWTAAAALEDAQRHGPLMPRQIEWIGRLTP